MALTIQQIQDNITNKYDQREIINQLADYIQANPGGNGGEVLSKKIVLNDDQIKSLPTVSVEIIPAVSNGKIILPIAFAAKLDATAGQYTNLDAGTTVLIIGWDNGAGGTLVDAMAYIRYSFVETLNIDWSFGSLIGRTDANIYDALQAFETGEQNIEAKSLVIAAYNAGNFTGGNAANSLTLTVYYSVVDL